MSETAAICDEILTSEQRYVAALQSLCDHYVAPAREAVYRVDPCITEQQVPAFTTKRVSSV